MRAKQLVRTGFGVAVIGAIAAVAWWPQPIDVDIAAVSSGRMRVTVDEDGETRVRDRFVVAAPVAGQLQRIELEPGDRVTRDVTVVARLAPVDAPLIDPRSRAELEAVVEAAKQAVGQARAERDRAVAARDRAAITARRFGNLVEAGAVSREDHDSAQTAMATTAKAAQGAEFALTRAERELDLAATRLQRPANRGRMVDVRSPVDGVVLKRQHESACVVAAGEPLLEVGDPAQLEVVADVLSTDAVRVRAGSRVDIERWGGSHGLRAHVQRVEPSGFMKLSALGVEEQRVNVIMHFDDPVTAARKLGDGYRVDARIVVWERDGVVMVPVGSLFRRGDQWSVFVVEGGRARLRAIELGERNNEIGEVRSGLAEGEHVVLHPPDMLGNGDRVRNRS